MKTVQNREEKSDILEYPFSSLDDEGSPKLRFEIRGLTNERSYEDREVFFRVCGRESGVKTPEPSVSMDGVSVEYVTEPPATVRHSGSNFQMWLRGEDAIDLGLKLIEHGKFALESNMINHQAIHTFRQFKGYLEEERVEEVQFEMIDASPVNYGDGFRLYKITPIWFDGMAPKYSEDFTFQTVIYWSQFEEEYADQLDEYTLGTSYSFIGYDHEQEVRLFKESVRLMSGNDV